MLSLQNTKEGKRSKLIFFLQISIPSFSGGRRLYHATVIRLLQITSMFEIADLGGNEYGTVHILQNLRPLCT